MSSSTHIPSRKKAVFFTAFFALLFTFSLHAQEPQYSIRFKLSVKDGDMKNALITITKNGAPYKVIDPSGGKYTIDLDFNAEYLITCTKPDYITKSIIIDTHVPKGREEDDFAKNQPTVELEKQPEDQLITYTQPVGKIKFNGISDDFDFDKDYTNKAQEMQKIAKENPKPKPKEPTPVPKAEPPKPVQAQLPPSKPEPVAVKPPEYKPEPPPAKPIVVDFTPETPPVVKNKEEKIIQKDRLKITLVTVSINGVPYEYRKEEYSWGGVYYYRDGKNITEPTYEKETE
jgi:hypothetical protein